MPKPQSAKAVKGSWTTGAKQNATHNLIYNTVMEVLNMHTPMLTRQQRNAVALLSAVKLREQVKVKERDE